MNGIDIANNIIFGNGDPGIIASYCSGSNVMIRNNLFLYNSGQDGNLPWYMNPNNTSSNLTWTASGNITNSDPSFINNTSNWHLQKCSPAIDNGLSLGTVTNDYDATLRPIPFGGSYDIGAYER